MAQFQLQAKRLILCCDGTWMDSDDGFTKPTLIPYHPTATLQVPSNITRISHALKRHGSDGMPQIIYYHSGVGTSSSFLDSLTGGLLGAGISENIREAYAFIANNYTPGDEIILIGFSRGAFTVRSVASMIRDIGLLTLEGMSTFYPIFKDQENFRNACYRDIFPDLPFSNKPKDEAGYDQEMYKKRLVENKLTRVHDPNGRTIVVQAVAVFDTVGSLGIPNSSFFARLGFPHATREFKFYDTNLSNHVKHAFQALALDEHRKPFSPAVWERKDHISTDLRQVWFPGAHSNVGGGYDDQEMSNVTLAWMMDQLASIGVGFKESYINKIFDQNVQFYENVIPKSGGIINRPWKQWAITPVYEKHHPIRPWGLGEIIDSGSGGWFLAGKVTRTPGLYMRADPDTGVPTNHPLVNTNERIHSSVRIRLDLDGLDSDDKGLYKCPALLSKGPWSLRKMRIKVQDPIPATATWGVNAPGAAEREDDIRWVWEYVGPEKNAPKNRIMIEESLGPYERHLLSLNKGRKEYKKRRRRKRKKDRDEEPPLTTGYYPKYDPGSSSHHHPQSRRSREEWEEKGKGKLEFAVPDVEYVPAEREKGKETEKKRRRRSAPVPEPIRDEREKGKGREQERERDSRREKETPRYERFGDGFREKTRMASTPVPTYTTTNTNTAERHQRVRIVEDRERERDRVRRYRAEGSQIRSVAGSSVSGRSEERRRRRRSSSQA